MSGDNLQALANRIIDAYIATDKGEKQHPTSLDESERRLTKSDFTYHEEGNTFTCPGGQTLHQVRQSKEGERVYHGNADVCANCPYQARCCQFQKGEACTITTGDNEPLSQQMNVKMAEQASKDIYSKRKVSVEPHIWTTQKHWISRFQCSRQRKKGLIRPEFGQWATNPAI